MSDRKGAFISIEEPGGQNTDNFYEQTVNKLRAEGYKVAAISFPKLEEESSHFVREYKKGNYQGNKQLDAYMAGMFYALDRFGAANKINNYLEKNQIVITRNWSAGNMADQAHKLPSAEARRGFYVWLDHLEYHMLDMPRPDKTYVIKTKSTDAEVEPDQIPDVVDELCRLFPKDFTCIDKTGSGRNLDNEQVIDMIMKSLTPLLPDKSEQKLAVDDSTTGKLVKDNDDGYKITEIGKKKLENIISNPKGKHYAITPNLDSFQTATLLSRFSRTDEPFKVSALKTEGRGGLDEESAIHYIKKYNDVSIHQMHSHYFVFEDISRWLSNHIQSQRQGSYIVKPEQYKKISDTDGHHNKPYVIPSSLDRLSETKYRAAMDNIYSSRYRIYQELIKNEQTETDTVRTQEAVDMLLPSSHKETLVALLDGQAIQSLVINLAATKQREAIDAAKSLAKYVYHAHPFIYHQLIDYAPAIEDIKASKELGSKLKEISASNESVSVSDNGQGQVTLLNFFPRNELYLLPQILYAYSDKPYKTLESEVSSWKIDKKMDVFSEYLEKTLKQAKSRGRPLEAANYTFEVICSRSTYSTLSRHRIVNAPSVQPQDMSLGKLIPEIIKKNDLAEEYEKCFELSEKLHRLLAEEGYVREADYALLCGHKLRYQFTVNARELTHIYKIHHNSKEQELFSIANEIYQKLSEVHPLVFQAVK